MKKFKQTIKSSILSPKSSRFKPVLVIVSAIIALFLFSALLTALDSKYRLAPSSMEDWTSKLSGETLLHFIGFENPYFTQVLPEGNKIQPVSSLALELVTSVEPGDIRSLLGGELPGFKVFDSEIIVAGKGTNYTNLPVESAPPLDVMMKEREVATEKLKDLDKPDKNKNKQPPAKTTDGKKVVYIYSTHSTESFLPILKGTDDPSDAYSSKVNVTDVGERIGKNLKKEGIGTKVNQTNFQKTLKNKGMKYAQSYQISRSAMASAIDNNSNLNLFFDIHRDTAPKKMTTVTIDNKKYARVWFVLGQGNPDYKKNEQMAKDLHGMLEKKYSGISRGVLGKKKDAGNNGIYNQDLSNHSILLEIGGPENSMKELYRTADALAEVIRDYYWQQQDAKKVNG